MFAEVLKQKPNALLMLVGDGEKKSEIKEQINALGIEESVIFTGVRSDVPALLSAMDVFVFPSFYEGMPNTVIEAQATGLPCVIADTITEEAGITGIVHYMPLSASPEQWAEQAIECASKERADTKEFFLREMYDVDSVVEKFVKLCY